MMLTPCYQYLHNNCYLKFENTFKIPGWLYPEMIDDYENDFDMEISIGSSLPDIELDEDVNYLREKQRKRWESSQMENFKRKLFFSNFQKIFVAYTLLYTVAFFRLSSVSSWAIKKCSIVKLHSPFDLTFTPKTTEKETEKAQ